MDTPFPWLPQLGFTTTDNRFFHSIPKHPAVLEYFSFEQVSHTHSVLLVNSLLQAISTDTQLEFSVSVASILLIFAVSQLQYAAAS